MLANYSVTSYAGNQSSPSSEQNVEIESVDDDLLVPDPAKVVLEIIHNPIMMGDNAVIIDDGDILLLKELRKISPDIRPHVREEAMKLALDVKAYISQKTENSVAILGFLLLLSIYRLAPSFDEDEVFKLFGFAAQHEIAVELFGTLGFADKEQFQQFVLPETTSMRALPKKVTTIGAPKKNKHFIQSTKRSPSLWEIVDSQEQQTQTSHSNSSGASRKSSRKSNMSPNPPKSIPKNPKPTPKNPKPTPVKVHIPHKDQMPIWMASRKSARKSNMSHNPPKLTPKNPNPTPVKVHIPHKDQIPIWMHDFIEIVVDVAGDGHCGFRAVAGLRNLSVDDHQMIRYQLHQELIGEGNARYRRMINDDKRYKDVLGALTYSGIGYAPPDKWMTMPDMGFLIAQKYNHAVVLLSTQKGRSETFFPLWGEPPLVERLMCMAHVNNNHFMIIKLKNDSPIPPTCPLWRQHARDDALSWLDRYASRMADYNELCRAAGFEVIGDDQDLYIIENLDPEEKVVEGKKPEDVVKLEKKDSFNLDDIDIDLGAI